MGRAAWRAFFAMKRILLRLVATGFALCAGSRLFAITITPFTPGGVTLDGVSLVTPAVLQAIGAGGADARLRYAIYANGTSFETAGNELVGTISESGAVVVTKQFHFSANPFLVSIESDGNQGPGVPRAYLFPIPFVTISQAAPLVLEGFWSGPGSVARVQFFLGAGYATPDGGSSAMLLAVAAVGLGLAHRWRRRRAGGAALRSSRTNG